VPPGRYLLFAIVNPFVKVEPVPGGAAIYQSNFASHYAVVDVCCTDRCRDICITLYNSGWHYCVTVIVHWFRMLAMTGKIDEKIANEAVSSLTKALESSRDKTLPTDKALIGELDKITRVFMKGSKKEEQK
jgi:hypothetical protein